jgi:hypothetical protein
MAPTGAAPALLAAAPALAVEVRPDLRGLEEVKAER